MMRKDRENPKHKEVHAKVRSNIKFRRELLGFKQDEIANALAISQENYSEYERGYRIMPAALLLNIAHVLACPVNDLYDGCVITDKKLKAKEALNRELTYKAKQIANMYDSLPESMQVHYFELLKNMSKNMGGNSDEEKQGVLFAEI